MSYEAFAAMEKFNRAKLRGQLRAILNILYRERNVLLAFNEARNLIPITGEAMKGMQQIAIKDIIGSEGRYRDFDRRFLPRAEYLRGRWENIAKAHIKAVNLPPIQVFKLAGCYFVRDGNHRVSVARSEGGEFIDAEVVELLSDLDLGDYKTAKALKKCIDHAVRNKFLQDTGLKQLPPAEQELLRFANPGFYEQALGHIQGHKYYLNQNQAGEISLAEAARSWYFNLFLPVVKIIIGKKLFKTFPGSCPADLYLWSVARWDELKKIYGGRYPLEDAVLGYAHEHGRRRWQRIVQRWHHQRGLLARPRQ